MQQAEGFPYGYAPPPLQTNEVGQNSRANMADPIAVPDLDDPKKQKKIRKESSEQSESNKAQWKLELIEGRLRMVEVSDAYSLIDASKMSLVPNFDKYDRTKCPSAHLSCIVGK